MQQNALVGHNTAALIIPSCMHVDGIRCGLLLQMLVLEGAANSVAVFAIATCAERRPHCRCIPVSSVIATQTIPTAEHAGNPVQQLRPRKY